MCLIQSVGNGLRGQLGFIQSDSISWSLNVLITVTVFIFDSESKLTATTGVSKSKSVGTRDVLFA